MTRITLEIYDDLVTTINKIKVINDTGVELEIPQGSVLFENSLNLKLLQKEAEKLEIVLHFTTEDEVGNRLIDALDDNEGNITGIDRLSSLSENLGTEPTEFIGRENPKENVFAKFGGFIPAIKLPRLKFGGNFKKSIILPIIIAFAIVSFGFYRINNQQATAKIIVNSQPLARSVPIKVKTTASESDVTNKILKGTQLSASIEKTGEIETTGQKLIGEKAKGTAKIYNKTDSETEFKKGTKLNFDDEGKDYVFVTKTTVTIAAAAPQDPLDPASPILPGETDVDIEAADIGPSYNLENNEILEVEGEKKSDFEAKTTSDLTGGKSETVKAVSEEDKKALAAKVTEDAKTETQNAIKSKLGQNQAFIEGSLQTTNAGDSFDKLVGDQADKLTLTQKIQVTGLVYVKNDLDSLLDKLVEGLIPEGYVVSNKDREIKVEVLGNSTDSVLNTTEADLQITFKTFIDPKIEEDKLKEELKGKSITEAQKILGGLRNIKTYELTFSNPVPFFNKLPKNTEKIEIVIERQ